jgi:hypothetical protein
MKNKKFFPIGLTIVSALSIGAASAAPMRTLTEAQMRRLALAGAKVSAPRSLKLPGFGFDRYNRNGCAFFEAWASVGEGIAGRYVVNPRTGDLWDCYGDCHRITSPYIGRLQDDFRRLGLSAAQYLKIARGDPKLDELPKC